MPDQFDLPDPNDPVVQQVHQAFAATLPELALTLRELVEAGEPRDRIMLHLKPPYTAQWLWDACGAEIDYLVATGAHGRSLRGMSADIPTAQAA